MRKNLFFIFFYFLRHFFPQSFFFTALDQSNQPAESFELSKLNFEDNVECNSMFISAISEKQGYMQDSVETLY